MRRDNSSPANQTAELYRRAPVRVKSMPRLCAGRSRSTAAEFLQKRIELVERAIREHELAAALSAGLDLHRRAEPVGPFFFEPRDVAIGACASRRSAFSGRSNPLFNLAHGQALRCGLSRKLDLL